MWCTKCLWPNMSSSYTVGGCSTSSVVAVARSYHSLAETKATMAASYVTYQSPASRELAAQSASPPGSAVEGAASIGQQQTSPVKRPGFPLALSTHVISTTTTPPQRLNTIPRSLTVGIAALIASADRKVLGARITTLLLS